MKNRRANALCLISIVLFAGVAMAQDNSTPVAIMRCRTILQQAHLTTTLADPCVPEVEPVYTVNQIVETSQIPVAEADTAAKSAKDLKSQIQDEMLRISEETALPTAAARFQKAGLTFLPQVLPPLAQQAQFPSAPSTQDQRISPEELPKIKAERGTSK